MGNKNSAPEVIILDGKQQKLCEKCRHYMEVENFASCGTRLSKKCHNCRKRKT